MEEDEPKPEWKPPPIAPNSKIELDVILGIPDLRPWTPEERLWASVLIRGIWDYAQYQYMLQSDDQEREKKLTIMERPSGLADSVRWIMNDSTEPCGFIWICRLLDLPYKKVRESAREIGLMELRKCSTHQQRPKRR